MTFAYSTLRREEISQLLELRNRTFASPMELAYWAWQNESNPNGRSITRVARESGQIVAHYTLLPCALHWEGKTIAGAQSVESFVEVSHRGRGLFPSLAEEVYRAAREAGIEFVFGLPNGSSYRPMVQKMGFHRLFDMHLYKKVLSTGYYTRRLPWIPQWRRSPPGSHQTGRWLKEIPLEWAQIPAPSHGLRRTMETLRWRYEASPRRYRFFGTEKGGAVLGESGGVVQIVDLFVAEQEERTPFLSAIEGKLAEEGRAHSVNCLLNEKNPWVLALAASGFRRAPGDYPVVGRFLHEPRMVRTSSDWHLVGGDTDLY